MTTGSHQYPWDQMSQGPPERRRRGRFIIRIWSSLRKSGWGQGLWSCWLPALPWRIRGVQYLKITSIRMIRPGASDSRSSGALPKGSRPLWFLLCTYFTCTVPRPSDSPQHRWDCRYFRSKATEWRVSDFQMLTASKWSAEKAMAPNSSTLAWKIPWMEEPGRLQSMGSLGVGLSDFPFTFHFLALEKEMATHSSVLAGESQGRGSLVGCCLWGRTESDTTEAS